MEELIGYVLINEKRYPFAFEFEKLKIYPITEQTDIGSEAYDELTPGVYAPKFERGKVIDEIEIIGMLVDGRDIVFGVYNNPSETEGFLTYSVVSYYIFKTKETVPVFEEVEGKRKIVRWDSYENAIDGLIISGREIDIYYDPSRVFVHRYASKDGSTRFSEFNVTATANEDEECGKFYVEDIECKLFIRSIARVTTSSKVPFNSFSELVLVFYKSITIEQADKVIASLRNCFQYLCHRSNIEFSNIETFCNTNDGKRRRFGKYKSFRFRNIEEENPKANRQVIAHDVIGDKLGLLMQSFINGEMYLNHLPKSVDDERKFGPDRMIFDFVAFETEYQNLYPEIVVRSEDFVSAKEIAIAAIDNVLAETTGKKRKKYLNSIRNSVTKIENSLGERIRYVMNECDDMMKPFLIYNYCADYKANVEDMCDRMNQLRNDCAHGNIQTSFDGTTLIDYNTLECLLYAMRLKAIKIADLKAQKAIASVMGINMYIPDQV